MARRSSKPGTSAPAPVAVPPADELEPGLRRITIKVTEQTYDDIRRMSRERGVTITELIKRALLVDDFFFQRRDQRVQLRSTDGQISEVLLVL